MKIAHSPARRAKPAPVANILPYQTTLLVRDCCLCLHVQRAARSLARSFDEALRPFGLTNGQFSLLMSLNRPEPPSMAPVASLLAMDRTTLTAALKPLERRGLVKISPDPNDRRSRILILTTFDLDEYVFDALRAGASGFLIKDAPAGQLTSAVRMIAAGEFLEIFVDTPLETAIARDPKGLYKRALAGEIKNFTGVDQAYEPPEAPELILNSAEATAEALADRVVKALEQRGLIVAL